MDQQKDDEKPCASCGKPIIEAGNMWHGHEICDLCFPELQARELQAGGILMCQHCGKHIQAPESAKLWMKKILCSVCDEKFHGPNSDPAARMAESLEDIAHQIERTTNHMRFIAACLAVVAIWFLLKLMGALVAVMALSSR